MPKKSQWMQNAESTSPNIWNTKPQYVNGHAAADNSFSLQREGDHSRLSRRGVHSDTASLITRSSWSSRHRDRHSGGKRCGLICMFIIGALIIAAAIACLVYFLLSSKFGKDRQHGRREADLSVRLLNKTYTPEMADNTSAAFRSVAIPFCEEMDKYFQRNYSKSYNGCRVVELRDVANREECSCMLKDGHGLVEVGFQLDFEGDVGDVNKKKLIDVIWGNMKRVQMENVDYYKIKNFLIDIHTAWQASKNGVKADLTIPVYNLTYTRDLEYENTTAYRQHAELFCADMDSFFKSSWLRDRYQGCNLHKYNMFPLSVGVDLTFNGKDIHSLQTDLIYIIMSKAKRVPFGNMELKMVGDLLVTPYDVDFELKPWYTTKTTPATTRATTTPTTTTTTSEPGIEVNKMYRLYNFTFIPALQFPDSPQFKSIAGPFCKDMERLHHISSDADKQHYFTCKIYGFGQDPNTVIFSIIYKGVDPNDLNGTIDHVIKKGAPKFIEKGKELFLVGNALVIMNETFIMPTTTLPPVSLISSIIEEYSSNTITDQGIFTSSDMFSSSMIDSISCSYCLTNSLPSHTSRQVIINPIKSPLNVYSLFVSDTAIVENIPSTEPSHDQGTSSIVLGSDTDTQSRFSPINDDATIMTRGPMSQVSSYGEKYIEISPMYASIVTNNDSWSSGIKTSAMDPEYTTGVSQVNLSANSLLKSFPSGLSMMEPVSSHVNRDSSIDMMLTDANVGFHIESSMKAAILSMASSSILPTTELGSVNSSLRKSMTISINPSMKPSMEPGMELSMEPSMELSMETSTKSMSTESVILISDSTTSSSTTVIVTQQPPVFTGVTQVDLLYRLYNFTYHPDLKDRTSVYYQVLKEETCRQVEYFLKMNRALDYIYQGCDIRFNPDSTMNIRLIYSTVHHQRLANVTMETLERHAPHLEIWPYQLLRVGRLYPIIGTGTGTETVVTETKPLMPSTIRPTSTITVTPSVAPTLPPKYDTTVARAVYRLYNFTYKPELVTNYSTYFQQLEKNFCDDIDRFYKSSFLFLTYQHCQINRFGSNPEDIEFDLYFYAEISDRLQDEIRFVLHNYAPHETFISRDIGRVETLDVGDLFLIIQNGSIRLIPRNWTKPTPTVETTTEFIKPTPTPITTTSLPLATIPVITYIRKARVTLGYKLCQFPFRKELLDRNSDQFKFYKDALCEDLGTLYSQAPAFRLLYETCDIEFFEENPEAIRYNLVFKTEKSGLLEGVVKETLENSRPRFNLPCDEAILVGGMFFILKDAYLDKSIFTLTTTVYGTALPEPTPTSTHVLETSSISIPVFYDATNVYLTYEVYNMTDWLDLHNKDSALFKLYRDRACKDLNDIYRDITGILFLTYKHCDIDRFHSNPLKTTFKLTFSQMMSDQLIDATRRTLEFKSLKRTDDGHLLMKAGDLWLILNRYEISQFPTNYTAPPTPTFQPTSTVMMTSSVFSSSPTISPTPSIIVMTSTKIIQPPTPPPTTPKPTPPPILYDAVLANVTYLLYNFTFTEDHRNPKSLAFRLEEQRFCDDVDKVYRNVFQSPFVFTYKECRVEAFQENPNTVRFHLIFAEDMRDELKTVIPNTLQRIATKLNISDYEVMDLGDLYLVIGQYMLTITHHNHTERPREPIITTARPTTPTTTPTTTTTTTTTTIKPTTTTEAIFPTEWVKMQFNANLWNFTWTPELLNPDSALFRQLELSFCNDISRFFGNSIMYTAYRGCKIDSFTTNPDEINFKIGFVSPLYPGLGTDIVNIIEANAPRSMVQDDFTLTAVMDIGGLFLVWKNFTFYIVSPGGLTSYWIPPSTITLPTPTSEPTYLLKLSFPVLNRTYTADLANKNSGEFRRQERLFCNQISEMLVNHPFRFPDYSKCEVDAFVDNPLRVNFSLAFRGQQPEEMKTRVIGIIIESSKRVNFNDLFALLIGDLTLAPRGFTTHIHNHGSIDTVVTPPSFDYDGLLYSYTFYLYDGNWTQQLTNPNSQLFKDTEAKFCADVDRYFRQHFLNQRYYACNVEKFGDYYNKDMVVNIVLDGTTDVGGPLVYDVIYQQAPFKVIDGIGWLDIGGLFVYANTTGNVRYIRFTNQQTLPTLPPTTPPQVSTFLHISFNVLNLTYTPALADSSSSLFNMYALPFCSYLDQIFTERNRFPNYDQCTVEEFLNNPVSVKFNLRFVGAQPENLQDLITGMLIEKAPRTVINNQIALVVGNLGIYERSLAVDQRTVTGSPITFPGGPVTAFPLPTQPFPNQFTPRPVNPANPCAGSNSIFVPHPTDCDQFYMCTGGQGVEIQCAAGARFDPNLSVCVNKPPGFVCRL